MRNYLRTNCYTAFTYDAVTENQNGGLALWDIPPVVSCLYNPIIFTRTKFWYYVSGQYTPSQQGYTIQPNYVGFTGTTVTLQQPSASALYVAVYTDTGVKNILIYQGRTEYYMSSECSQIFYIVSVSLTPTNTAEANYCQDSSFIYIRKGYAYSDDNYICTAEGQYLYKDQKTISTVNLDVYKHNGKWQSLFAEPYKGIVKFDVSLLVRSWLKSELVDFGNSRNIQDGALAVKFIIRGIGGVGWEKTFLGVNAVAQIGESSDLTTKGGSVLTRFPHLHLYANYPLDYSMLGVDGDTDIHGAAIPDLSVTRYLVSGTERELKFSSNEGANIEYEEDKEILILDKADINIFARRMPLYPFYVRWVNRLGGVDYWMFSASQKYISSVKSTDTFVQFVENPATANSNLKPFRLSTENTITVGAEQLNKAEYTALSELPYSPLIECYNSAKNAWIRLAVANFDGTNNSDAETKSVEVKFTLPAINTQF